MEVVDVIIVSVALAMDAFGVTLGIGVNDKVKRLEKLLYIFSFGFFQFLLSFIGGISGYLFNNYLIPISSTIGGIVVGSVGILMIVDGLKNNDDSILTKKTMIIILGISVSIDALVIGFTIFNNIERISVLFLYTILIGLITLLICTIGFSICRFIRKISFVKQYANLFGGLALILFSIKIIFF
ncbi:manganese efflux pump MntP family protein [Clostridium cibarium]|uniref:Manganese efflux pump n=1 Tax=Clostridium cibarium TaxID=2762247 RepID=A0ABR8PPB1_9CLOT|nr:manganese efflux pump [Clostridium cibarium]MBD7909909.1 manganese efflux pump [Clostridium cibarium]